MRLSSKLLIVYFLVLIALSVIAVIPGGALMALLFFIFPGLLVIPAPTVLLYSIALLPLRRALTAPHPRMWTIWGAALIPVAIAVGPGLLSRAEVRQYATLMSDEDMSRRAVAKPRSIEFDGDFPSGMFMYAQTVGDKNASCTEVCRRLLFNGEVQWVRMTKRAETMAWSITYRLEHRESCPQLYPAGTTIEKSVRDRLIAGDCLVIDSNNTTAPDARVKYTTRYYNQYYPPRLPYKGPMHATIETTKDIVIESWQNGAPVPVVRQTEVVADTLALPFYIGTEMHMQGGYNGPTIGRDKTVMKPIDLAHALRDTFEYKVAEISAPAPEDPGKVAERILALPPDANQALSAQQQDAINDVLVAIAQQPMLSDENIEFVRRVIADNRVTEGKLGIVIQTMFRKFASRLESLIPVVLDRISTPVPERVGHYQSMLGWSLMNFSADSLRPYRDRMVAIVEAQSDWPSGGVLTRLAEVGGDEAVNLVIRRLDSKSARQFAAVAACRANPEAWAALEPAVLAHLTPPRQGNNLQDDERPLLLALVRFGKKPLVADMIEKRGLFDNKRTFERLEKFEAGFGPNRCRDFF